MIVQRRKELICKDLPSRQVLTNRSQRPGFVVSQVPKCKGPGAPG